MDAKKIKYMVLDLTLGMMFDEAIYDSESRLFTTEKAIIEYANEHYHETEDLLKDYKADFEIKTFQEAVAYFKNREYEVYEIKPIKGA